VASIPKSVLSTVRARLDRLPVWPPGVSTALGEVGRFDKRGWVNLTTLADLGIATRTEAAGVPADLELTSTRGVSISQQVNAAAVVGDATLRFDFAAENAFAFRAYAMTTTRLSDLRELERQIIGHAEWRPDWTVVTEVSTAGMNCVLIAAESGASVTLKVAAGPTMAAVDPTTGLTANARLAITSRRGMGTAWATDKPTAALMRAHYLHAGIFHEPRLRDRGEGEATQQPPNLPPRLVEITDIDIAGDPIVSNDPTRAGDDGH
jgi:hypothetical protein